MKTPMNHLNTGDSPGGSMRSRMRTFLLIILLMNVCLLTFGRTTAWADPLPLQIIDDPVLGPQSLLFDPNTGMEWLRFNHVLNEKRTLADWLTTLATEPDLQGFSLPSLLTLTRELWDNGGVGPEQNGVVDSTTFLNAGLFVQAMGVDATPLNCLLDNVGPCEYQISGWTEDTVDVDVGFISPTIVGVAFDPGGIGQIFQVIINSSRHSPTDTRLQAYIYRTASIPIPSTLLIFGLGFAGFVAWRYREEKLSKN